MLMVEMKKPPKWWLVLWLLVQSKEVYYLTSLFVQLVELALKVEYFLGLFLEPFRCFIHHYNSQLLVSQPVAAVLFAIAAAGCYRTRLPHHAMTDPY
jgi:hypothetical protein